MPKLVYIVTHWSAAHWHLRGQLAFMRQQGFDVTLITSGPKDDLARLASREQVRVVGVPMAREINPPVDGRALQRLFRTLRALQPDIVNASTPKAGLLGMQAAFALRVPARVYMLRGLRLETTSGVKHTILRTTERITSRCAHEVLCTSHSLRQVYLDMGLTHPDKARVLGQGSSNGVEIERFAPQPSLSAEAQAIRHTFNIQPNDEVIGFVGRFTRDKGICELVTAFLKLSQRRPRLHLLLVGDFEAGDPIPLAVRRCCRAHPKIHLTGFVPEPAPYFHAMDLLAFPSYREGLPNVPMQAAAAGLPVVAFAATGTIDVVRDGETGRLVPVADTDALTKALANYLDNPWLRRQHGTAGQAWVNDAFHPKRVWSQLCEAYDALLKRM